METKDKKVFINVNGLDEVNSRERPGVSFARPKKAL